MKFILKLVVVICFSQSLSGCKDQNEKSISAQSTSSAADTGQQSHKKKDTETFSQPNPSEIFENYVKGYSESVNIDTSFNWEGRKIIVLFKHYCTFDSTVHVPGKYVAVYGLKEFTTHSFKSSLKIIADSSLIIDTIVNKNMFEGVIPDEEKMFGVLLHPYLHFLKNTLEINYSISIPVTDVGVSVEMECDYYGKISIKKS